MEFSIGLSIVYAVILFFIILSGMILFIKDRHIDRRIDIKISDDETEDNTQDGEQ